MGSGSAIRPQRLHFGEEVPEQRVIALQDEPGDFVSHGLIVSVGGLVAAADHVHPAFTVGNEAFVEGFPGGIAGARNGRVALVKEIIPHDVPGEFVSEFEGLDEPLLLQIGQWAPAGQICGGGEGGQSSGVVRQALLPADVLGHGALLSGLRVRTACART